MRNFSVTVTDTDTNFAVTKSVHCEDGDVTVLRVYLSQALSESIKEVEANNPSRLAKDLATVLEKHGLDPKTIQSMSSEDIVDAVTKAGQKK